MHSLVSLGCGNRLRHVLIDVLLVVVFVVVGLRVGLFHQFGWQMVVTMRMADLCMGPTLLRLLLFEWLFSNSWQSGLQLIGDVTLQSADVLFSLGCLFLCLLKQNLQFPHSELTIDLSFVGNLFG